jgi:hypothetical protein
MTVFNDADAKTHNSALSKRPDTNKDEESQAVSARLTRLEALEAKYAALEAQVAKRVAPSVTPKLTRPWPLGLRSLKLGLATAIGLSAVLATAAGTFEVAPDLSSVPNSLTYEGYLEVDGEPAGGSYDMKITLHGCRRATPLPSEPDCVDFEEPKTWVFDGVRPNPDPVEVAAGRFAVELPDLDESHFDEPGRELWVAVRVGGVDLNGRQKLNSVPFAVKSRNADHAANALTAESAAGALEERLAIIENEPADFSGYEIVTNTHRAAGHFDVFVACPGEKRVIGGGCNQGSGSNRAMINNNPHGTSGWECRSRDVLNGETVTLTAYAICVTVP